MPRHILIKLSKAKHKERILKAAREKQVTYKGNPTCLTADLSAETLQARREWQDIFKVLKGKILQPGLLYPAKISLKIDGEIKRIIRDYYEQLYGNKMDNLKEMDRFLEKFHILRLKQEETEIMNNPITSTEIEAVIKNLPKKIKAQDQMASQENSIKHLEKS